MQNKKQTPELLTRRQLKQFKKAPMRFFTRNTEHLLTTQNIFENAAILQFIADTNYLTLQFVPSCATPIALLANDFSVNKAMSILINQVKNN